MSDTVTSNGKIVIGFAPTVVHPIPGVHPPNTPSRAGGYNTWVEVSHDFTLDRVGEIFDVQLPWLKDLGSDNQEQVPSSLRKEIQVTSSDGKKKYVVIREVNGKTYCSCPGFGFHGYCKHQDYIDNPDAIPVPKKSVKINLGQATTNHQPAGKPKIVKISI